MSSDDARGQALTRAARLPAPGEHGRQSLRPADVSSLSAQDQEAVKKLLAMSALDDD